MSLMSIFFNNAAAPRRLPSIRTTAPVAIVSLTGSTSVKAIKETDNIAIASAIVFIAFAFAFKDNEVRNDLRLTLRSSKKSNVFVAIPEMNSKKSATFLRNHSNPARLATTIIVPKKSPNLSFKDEKKSPSLIRNISNFVPMSPNLSLTVAQKSFIAFPRLSNMVVPSAYLKKKSSTVFLKSINTFLIPSKEKSLKDLSLSMNSLTFSTPSDHLPESSLDISENPSFIRDKKD